MSKKIDWKKNQPIIHHLRELLPKFFPVWTEEGHGKHKTGVGGYIHRTLRHNKKKMSLHSEGRAADIFLDVNVQREKIIAEVLIQILCMFRLLFQGININQQF